MLQGGGRKRGPLLSSSISGGAISTAAPDGRVASSPPNAAAKLRLRDNRSVIIPDHIRASAADGTMLCFGSFDDEGFEAPSSNPSHAFAGRESTSAVGDLTASMRSLSTGCLFNMPPSTNLEHEQPFSSFPLPQHDTYYSDVFCPESEIDPGFLAYSQLVASGKFISRLAETSGQNASLEVTYNSLPVLSEPFSTQPSGLPLDPVRNVPGYQDVPPGFSHVQSPYQHNYGGTSNYHQVPTAMGAGGMQFPVPQYNRGRRVVGGIQSTMSPSSLGYGGYPNSQPIPNLHSTMSPSSLGYREYSNSQPIANLPDTYGNTSTFDDAATQHFKDNMYLPSKQIDGPSDWRLSQLAREAQGISYNNVREQSQPTRYSQTQSHAHPAAVHGGNIYHPRQSGSSPPSTHQLLQQQSGSNPSAHQLLQQQSGWNPRAQQLLQQQQALGSMGAQGTQIGPYQQNERAQPTRGPGPY